MPHPAGAARAHVNAVHPNNRLPHVNAQTRPNNAQALANNTQARVNSGTTIGLKTGAISPNSYVYGTGSKARPYRAYGYGRGYRNNYNGGRSGYGQSQGNTRAVVSRLRSVHSSLARLDHDYQGHRVRAMHQISLAVRQLSHRSASSYNRGFSNQGNIGLISANGQRGNGINHQGGANGRRTIHLTQAQSDSRMSQALRTTQGIAMQLAHHGNGGSGHSRAGAHLRQAVHEMGVALQIR